MLIDAHTHIQFPAYDGDRDAVIARAQEAGVKMIAVGTQYSTSRDAVALAEKHFYEIAATVGFHPSHCSAAWHHDRNEQRKAAPEQFDSAHLRALARNPRVVAIGECGLDYFRVTSGTRQETKERQKKVFLAQVAVAEELRKPLMIHCRPSKGTDDAYEDLLNLATHYQFSVPRVVHFYAGSPAVTHTLLDAGFYFTFGGVITFSRDYDEAIRMIPLERILLETDAPYVAPEPYRGKRNEPAFIVETARQLASLKSVSFDQIVEETARNTQELFRFPE